MNYRGYLEYEIVHKPFLAGTTTINRACEILRKVENTPYGIESFIAHLQKNYSKLFPMIEFIRFHDFDFVGRKRILHFRVAMVFTKPNESIRNILYDDSEAITLLTGWYPFITGSRAEIERLSYIKLREKYDIKRSFIKKFDLGKPLEVINISSESTASATLLKCCNGCILFDTGFGIKKEYIEIIDIIFISHFHNDHIGGLINILSSHPMPVLVSEITLDYILQQVTFDADIQQLILRCAITLEEAKNFINFHNYFDYFQVFHAPGSFAFVYKFQADISVVYLGDICFNNAFYNSTEKCINAINRIKTHSKVIICDAALIGKKEESIGDDTPKDIINTIESTIKKRNTIFISPNAETLVYSYLLFFKWVLKNKDTKVKIVVSENIYNLLRELWRPRIYRYNKKDLFIDDVFKSNGNFVETYRLYPISSIGGLKDFQNTVFFLTINDMEQFIDTIPIAKSDVVLAGVWTIREGIPDVVTKNPPRSVTRVSSADWSFHSNEADLVSFTKIICHDKNNHVIFFHNYSKVIRKFLKNNDLENLSDSLGESGIIL